jgi:NAD(P)H dehydrogenase (quinone)
MIIVTGATGKLGELIIRDLVDRCPAGQLAVSVRDPAKAKALSELGVRVRHGDFTQPNSLVHAFEGATQLLFVSSGAQAHGGDPIAQHRAAIDAAKAAGARRILYTSHMGASANSCFPPMHVHAATEAMLAQCGIAWTALRNGFYASRAIRESDNARQTGTIVAPEDGKVAWTTHADLGGAAAAILANEGCFDGPTPPLTGAEALDFADIAAIMTDLLKRPISRTVVSDSEFENQAVRRGLPAAMAKMSVGFYAAARAREFSIVDPTLERLIGRRSQTVREQISLEIAGRASA